MKALLVALSLLLPGSLSTPYSFTTTCAANACTGAAPTLATDGLSLTDLQGCAICFAAPAGQTITGTGTIQVYRRTITGAQWLRNSDLDLTVNLSGVAGQCFSDNTLVARAGRGAWVPNLVGISGASGTATVEVDCWTTP